MWYNSSGDIHLEIVNAEFEEYLLNLSYSVTGLLEIAVTFSSSGVCNKTSVTQYHGKTVVWSFLCVTLSSFSHWPVEGVLTGVSVSSTTLIIESRDCIGSGEEYRIVATFTNTSTELVNVPFTSIIEHDLGDRVMDNTEYSITVSVVDMTSGTVIDERTVMFTTPSELPPETSATDTHCTCGAVDEEDDEKVTYIAVGVSCGVLLGLVVGVIATVLVVVMKKMNTSQCDKGHLHAVCIELLVSRVMYCCL